MTFCIWHTEEIKSLLLCRTTPAGQSCPCPPSVEETCVSVFVTCSWSMGEKAEVADSQGVRTVNSATLFQTADQSVCRAQHFITLDPVCGVAQTHIHWTVSQQSLSGSNPLHHPSREHLIVHVHKPRSLIFPALVRTFPCVLQMPAHPSRSVVEKSRLVLLHPFHMSAQACLPLDPGDTGM